LIFQGLAWGSYNSFSPKIIILGFLADSWVQVYNLYYDILDNKKLILKWETKLSSFLTYHSKFLVTTNYMLMYILASDLLQKRNKCIFKTKNSCSLGVICILYKSLLFINCVFRNQYENYLDLYIYQKSLNMRLKPCFWYTITTLILCGNNS
jgi:hypothetical protein